MPAELGGYRLYVGFIYIYNLWCRVGKNSGPEDCLRSWDPLLTSVFWNFTQSSTSTSTLCLLKSRWLLSSITTSSLSQCYHKCQWKGQHHCSYNWSWELYHSYCAHWLDIACVPQIVKMWTQWLGIATPLSKKVIFSFVLHKLYVHNATILCLLCHSSLVW